MSNVNWRLHVINAKEPFVLNVPHSLRYNIYLIAAPELSSVYNFVHVLLLLVAAHFSSYQHFILVYVMNSKIVYVIAWVLLDYLIDIWAKKNHQ